MEYKLMLTHAEWDAWFVQRRKHDLDFDPDTPNFPALVIWTDTEANGYNDVHWESISVNELRDMIDSMN